MSKRSQMLRLIKHPCDGQGRVINQLAIMILMETHFVIRQCLKGKSIACSRSKDIKERLSWKAIGKVNSMEQIRNPGQVLSLSTASLWYKNSGPVTIPTSISATGQVHY